MAENSVILVEKTDEEIKSVREYNSLKVARDEMLLDAMTHFGFNSLEELNELANSSFCWGYEQGSEKVLRIEDNRVFYYESKWEDFEEYYNTSKEWFLAEKLAS